MSHKATQRHHTEVEAGDVSFRKDLTLDRLAERFNIAQFVSYAPDVHGPKQQFSRVLGREPNEHFESIEEAIETLLRASAGAVNLRTFNKEVRQSSAFHYGLSSRDEIVALLRALSADKLFVIVNETIDVSDGGVSGVMLGEVVEFRPDATPRGVERPGFAAMSRAWASELFRRVYRIDVDLEVEGRLEFSLHPQRRGWKRSHMIAWEYEHTALRPVTPLPLWPNDFSRMVGDKVFGLLLADLAGLNVPFTTVVNRRVAPFSFGRSTGNSETWLRTSPAEQVPGKYTTARGWRDPFALLVDEDPSGLILPSVLAQSAVDSQWSGAAIETSDGHLVVEGVRGVGDRFMQGDVPPDVLPDDVLSQVASVFRSAQSSFGPVRFEWAFDGLRVWVLQLHRGRSDSTATMIVPGSPTSWREFEIRDGLQALRQLVASLPSDTGIIVIGSVGLTSHVADVLRRSGVPSRIRR